MTLLDIPTIPDIGEQAPFQTPWLARANKDADMVATVFWPNDCLQEPWGDWGTGEALLTDRDMLGGLEVAEELANKYETARAVLFVTALTWVRLREVEADAYETGPEVRASEMLGSLAKWDPEGWSGTASVTARAQGVFDKLRQIPTEVPEAQQIALGFMSLAAVVAEMENGVREDDVRLLLFIASYLRRQVLESRPEWRKSVFAEIGMLLPAVWSHVAAQTAPA